ncbi:MAG TPA: hypothetical protein VFQ07_05200, partial [Candidatus Polarisedimenticolia bacterium]|nr:hypothetical protein [Candidatus Polarisedimenticolia bacterium]
MTIVHRPSLRRGFLLTAVFIGLCAIGPPADAARRPAADRGSRARSQLLLRTGDPAPIAARVPQALGWTVGFLPDGRTTFIAGQDEILGILDQGRPRILLHTGQIVEGCGVIRGIYYHAGGADGTTAVLVQCTGGQAILRVDADSGAATVALMPLAGIQRYPGPDFLGYLAGTSVDGQGRIITLLGNGLDYDTIIRLSPGREPETIVKTGDPLGGGTLVVLRREPSVASSGDVAFAALTSLGTEVVAVVTPGGSPRVLLSVPASDPGNFYAPPFSLAPPAINADGVVGVLSGTYDAITVVRVGASGDVSSIHAGDPAPGGRTFSTINWVYPAVDDAGGVIFGARIAGGGGGLYRFDGLVTTPVAEDHVANPASRLVTVGDSSIRPLACSDGAIRFVAADDAGYGIFAWREGLPEAEVHSGDPMDEPARFVRFRNFGQHLSLGPFMASDGAVLFDALTTGHGLGLFVRQPDGSLQPVAIDGDEAPGGGHFVGEIFGFHSIAPGGWVAFIGEGAPDGFYDLKRDLYAGRIGQLQRLLSEGDSLPWSAAEIRSLGPPSPINSGGAIVLPVTMSDDWTYLLAWDGAQWSRLAGTGDTLPDGGIIARIEAGRADAPLPPALGDDGSVVFGVVTVSGGPALYRMTLGGGLNSAVRIIGNGDPVPGGTLEPFILQAFAADRDGRLAIQAVPKDKTRAATYLLAPGRATVRLAGLPPPFPPPPFFEYPPDAARPRLAMAGGGVVHEETIAYRTTLVLATPRASQGPGGTAFEQADLVGSFSPSPDGGYFGGGIMGGGLGPEPLDGLRSPT